MLMNDRGGWYSGPMDEKDTVCPHCGNDHARMFDSIIYGKKTKTVFCRVCAKESEHDLEDDDRD
jgi:protein-arginine kinase activator protein McsA